MKQSRRGFLGFLLGGSAGVVAGALPATVTQQSAPAPTPKPDAPEPSLQVGPNPNVEPGDVARAALRLHVGDEVFDSWFHTMQFEHYDGKTVTISLPVKFHIKWIRAHHYDDLLVSCRAEFPCARRVAVVLRTPDMVRLPSA